jgi:hypothetical protein
VAQGVGPEFKTHYCKKQKTKKTFNRYLVKIYLLEVSWKKQLRFGDCLKCSQGLEVFGDWIIRGEGKLKCHV